MTPFIKTTALLLLLIYISSSAFCQQEAPKKNARKWKAIVRCHGVRLEGVLYSVTDTSLTLLIPGHRFDEVNFNEIRKIKLVRTSDKDATLIAGILVGGAAGAWAGSSSLSKNKAGEPRSLSGIYGGLGGGVLGAVIGGLLGPVLYDRWGAKKFSVQNDTAFYSLLKLKLQPYCYK